MDMDEPPNAVVPSFENLGLPPFGVVRFPVGPGGVERPGEFRPGRVAVELNFEVLFP